MPICLPMPVPVPGEVGTPNWWDTSAGASPLNTSTDDIRWKGAFSHSFGSGGGAQVIFRGVNTGNNRLLLSWLIKVGTVEPGVDTLYVGFSPAGTAAMVVGITIATAGSTTAGTQAAGAYTPSVFLKPAAGGWSNTSVAAPAWVTTSTRAWINTTNPNLVWGVQMMVPLGVELSPNAATASINLAGATNFRMWYTAYVALMTGPRAPVIEYPWPGKGGADTGFPLPNTWDEARTANSPADPACTASGISIGVLGIGTKNVDGSMRPNASLIKLDLDGNPPLGDAPNSNRFFAAPTFPAGLSDARKQAVRARFRIANWGSQVGDSPSWQNIPGGDDVPFDLAANEAHFQWPTTPELAIANSETRILYNRFKNRTYMLHQCVLVELTSGFAGGETFLNNSAHRNMDIVNASRFERVAEISVIGLAPINLVRPRDVFLYLETHNMPPKVEEEPDDDGPQNIPTLRGRRGQFAASAVAGPIRDDDTQLPDPTDIAPRIPTYRVHGYHDTGRRITRLDGTSHLIVEPQTSFGYFVLHEGELVGWAARLQGADRIADAVYLIRVPNNGTAQVNTVIQAIENVNEPIVPEAPIVPWKDTPPDGCPAVLLSLLRLLMALFKPLIDLINRRP